MVDWTLKSNPTTNKIISFSPQHSIHLSFSFFPVCCYCIYIYIQEFPRLCVVVTITESWSMFCTCIAISVRSVFARFSLFDLFYCAPFDLFTHFQCCFNLCCLPIPSCMCIYFALHLSICLFSHGNQFLKFKGRPQAKKQQHRLY